jgi:transcriptional regulator with PAS, ATPase and Fis domain
VLRALQEREIRRVGDERVSKVDVRIVAATNRDLGKLVAAGKLREDFYYRIRVFDIVMPPLRDRREDIPLLVDHFIGRLSTASGKAVRGVAPLALRALMAYRWPGNVRELSNAVEHAFVTLSGDLLDFTDLPEPIRQAEAEGDILPDDDAGWKLRIEEALSQAGGNRSDAAKLLGVSRVTLWKWMKKLGSVNEDP